ncbi:PA-phosphatase related-family protein DDB_G0284367 [Hondaea fermentalgiana]|uniref:PA-phosphatase related-family protein DDB_G0284367 n=1 Tax=Hondaea fermentalgiana TaxID=2315210 RepID=A0A2R5GRT8_9STRA|nr:PA-phosphatase related-family protein DDB_G0284367 [Hondaea fermentalgiana]|eukprot:GBG30594.1 PA-phosphatase related-family protein DDB_G0284367 [Hondaea fermentalgiana]
MMGPLFALHRLGSRADDDGENPHDKLPYKLSNPFTIMAYYAIDWVAAIALVLLTVFARRIARSPRFYEDNDPSFSYPYQEDTVSTTALGFIGVGVPLVTGILTEMVLMARLRAWPFFLDAHAFCLGIMQSHALAQLVTIVLKGSVGRLRPSAFGRREKGGYSWNESFPSGHTSLSFTGMVFLALFLAAKSGIFCKRGLLFYTTSDRQGDPFRGSFAIGLGVFVAPLALAIFVGASRLIDYAHDFSDVNAGAAIGTAAAVFAYHCNYPSITSELGALPRPLAHLHCADPDWIRYYHHAQISSLPLHAADREFDEGSVPLREASSQSATELTRVDEVGNNRHGSHHSNISNRSSDS